MALKEPEFLITDFAKWDRPGQLHIAVQALHAFKEKHTSLPRPWNDDDAAELIALAKEVESDIELDEDIISTLSKTAAGGLCSITAVLGGHIAQEVIKSVTGKYTPLNQWVRY